MPWTGFCKFDSLLKYLYIKAQHEQAFQKTALMGENSGRVHTLLPNCWTTPKLWLYIITDGAKMGVNLALRDCYTQDFGVLQAGYLRVYQPLLMPNFYDLFLNQKWQIPVLCQVCKDIMIDQAHDKTLAYEEPASKNQIFSEHKKNVYLWQWMVKEPYSVRHWNWSSNCRNKKKHFWLEGDLKLGHHLTAINPS